MSEVVIRLATREDVPAVAPLLSAMLEDMEQAGGHRASDRARAALQRPVDRGRMLR